MHNGFWFEAHLRGAMIIRAIRIHRKEFPGKFLCSFGKFEASWIWRREWDSGEQLLGTNCYKSYSHQRNYSNLYHLRSWPCAQAWKKTLPKKPNQPKKPQSIWCLREVRFLFRLHSEELALVFQMGAKLRGNYQEWKCRYGFLTELKRTHGQEFGSITLPSLWKLHLSQHCNEVLAVQEICLQRVCSIDLEDFMMVPSTHPSGKFPFTR